MKNSLRSRRRKVIGHTNWSDILQHRSMKSRKKSLYNCQTNIQAVKRKKKSQGNRPLNKNIHKMNQKRRNLYSNFSLVNFPKTNLLCTKNSPKKIKTILLQSYYHRRSIIIPPQRSHSPLNTPLKPKNASHPANTLKKAKLRVITLLSLKASVRCKVLTKIKNMVPWKNSLRNMSNYWKNRLRGVQKKINKNRPEYRVHLRKNYGKRILIRK